MRKIKRVQSGSLKANQPNDSSTGRNYNNQSNYQLGKGHGHIHTLEAPSGSVNDPFVTVEWRMAIFWCDPWPFGPEGHLVAESGSSDPLPPPWAPGPPPSLWTKGFGNPWLNMEVHVKEFWTEGSETWPIIVEKQKLLIKGWWEQEFEQRISRTYCWTVGGLNKGIQEQETEQRIWEEHEVEQRVLEKRRFNTEFRYWKIKETETNHSRNWSSWTKNVKTKALHKEY